MITIDDHCHCQHDHDHHDWGECVLCERPRVLCVVGEVWGRMMILKNHDSYSYSQDPDHDYSL